MHVLLFDKCPDRREAWKRLSDEQQAKFQSFEVFSNELFATPTESRLIIFDQSSIADCLTAARELIPKLKQDAVAFTLPECGLSTAQRLLRLGAAWVFDNQLADEHLASDFTELLRRAREHNQQFQLYQHMQSICGKLSSAEKEVLALVLEGMPNKSIAKQLNISVRTVESRRSKTYRKCNVHSVTALVRFVDKVEMLKHQFGSPEDPQTISPQSAGEQTTDPVV